LSADVHVYVKAIVQIKHLKFKYNHHESVSKFHTHVIIVWG